MLSNVDFVGYKDLRELGFDDGPEYGHRCTYYGEINFEAGEHDRNWCPPSEIDVGRGPGFVEDDGVETPDGGEDDAEEIISNEIE